MTVWSAGAAMFPGLSLLATVCVAGCGGGSGNGHQVREVDAAVAPPAAEGGGGGGDYFASEIGHRPDASVARGGAAGASGATDASAVNGTSDAQRPTEGGATEATKPSCTPEAGADEPDDDFVDSNCDGIDGDAATAVFVAPSGHDDAEGSMNAPFKTVTHAVAIAASAGKNVYLCDAEYPEALELSGTAVSVYGGYACDRGWRRELDRATLDPPSGIPFVAKSVAAPVVVQRVAFKSPATTGPGESSIAASVIKSKQIRFVRVLFQASTGQDGERGAAVSDPKSSPIRQPAATDAVPLEGADHCFAREPGSLDGYGDPNCNQLAAGATGRARSCPDGTGVRGGSGGDGGSFYFSDTRSLAAAGSPGVPAAFGRDGTAGAVGGSGRAASASFGQIVDGAYVANNDGENGGYGHRGRSGQGGDGGNGIVGSTSLIVSYTPGGGGGQGGYAGCGGRGGKKGYGGGASIALIAVDSGVSVEWSTLETGHGGNGGNGSDGAPGQPGGRGGKGAQGSGTAFKGGDGGNGGDGGPGGSGGPGSGGPSVGIAWMFEAPTVSHVTFVLGTPGRGGTSSSGSTGADGVGAETYPPAEAGTAGK